jgi:hypothetical protein
LRKLASLDLRRCGWVFFEMLRILDVFSLTLTLSRYPNDSVVIRQERGLQAAST